MLPRQCGFLRGAPTPYARAELSREEEFAFQATGFLRVPSVLSSGEVDALVDNCAAAAVGNESPLLQDAVRQLLVNPTSVWYLNQILGAGFRLDTEPELLPEEPQPRWLSGGAMPRRPKDAFYYSRLGKRQCNSVRVLFALGDIQASDGGFVVVPCSHSVNVEAPKCVLHGHDSLRYLGEGIVFQPPMDAGDMLVVAGACLHGLVPWRGRRSQRLLSLRFVGRSIVGAMGPHVPPDPALQEPWWEALTESQRVSLGRGSGHGPQSTPAPTILTDGVQSTSLDPSGEVVHPSIYVRDPHSGIDEAEFYHWDLCGYLILRNVMDPAWIRAANEAVDAHEKQIQPNAKPLGRSGGVAATRQDEWAGRPTLGGLLQLEEPHAEPFRRMIAHPVVQHRLNWMGGSGLRGGSGAVFATVEGGSGHSLHDGAGGWPHMCVDSHMTLHMLTQ